MGIDIDGKEMYMAVINRMPGRIRLIRALGAIENEEQTFSLAFVKSHLLQEEQLMQMRTKTSNATSAASASVSTRNRNRPAYQK